MESILTSSGLAVCYQGADYNTVSRALRQRDPRLLLDKDTDAWGREVWCVRLRVGDNHKDWPMYVWWVDPDDNPRPLSLGIVDQLDSQEVRRKADVMDGKRLARSAEHVRQRHNEEARQLYEDIYREHEHRASPAHGRPVTYSTSLKTKGR